MFDEQKGLKREINGFFKYQLIKDLKISYLEILLFQIAINYMSYKKSRYEYESISTTFHNLLILQLLSVI